MTDLITAKEAQKLLDGATPGPWRADGEPWNRVVWSPNGNRVCFMAHSSGLDDARDIATSNLAAAAPELARALLAARADAKAAVAIVVEKAAEILDGYETIDDESAARGVRWQVDLPAQIASAIRALAPEDAIAEVARIRQNAEATNGVWQANLRLIAERDRLAAELAAAIAREAGLREALTRQGDNMAFVLNHMTMPDGYYGKFIHELEEDRAALAQPAGMAGKGE